MLVKHWDRTGSERQDGHGCPGQAGDQTPLSPDVRSARLREGRAAPATGEPNTPAQAQVRVWNLTSEKGDVKPGSETSLNHFTEKRKKKGGKNRRVTSVPSRQQAYEGLRTKEPRDGNALGASKTPRLGEEGSDWAGALGRGKHGNVLQTQVLGGEGRRRWERDSGS